MARNAPKSKPDREVAERDVVARGSNTRIVEAAWVKMLRTGRIVLAASQEVRFSRGDVVLIHTERGDVHARAITDSARQTLSPAVYLPVSRRLQVGEVDAVLGRDRSREEEARQVFIREVRKHKLDMRLSQVEAAHGDARIIFYFTAPGRVDFRGLVRDLASSLHSRIELRQIGVRDEARCAGGLGPCGLPLCCATFLMDFATVTIRMAKTQGLVLNPQKVSGLCGRLMCCLAYEHEVYCDMRKEFPRVGSLIMTPKGEGKVKDLQIMRRVVKVSLGPGHFEEFSLDDLEVKSGCGQKCRRAAPEEGAGEERPGSPDKAGEKPLERERKREKTQNKESGRDSGRRSGRDGGRTPGRNRNRRTPPRK
ncbi:MAG: stage 0 sporulation protein [Deltaproteobacteria bacterium]|nr:stage 0 sporulation protein [Deltaproteobacteria bacterium]